MTRITYYDLSGPHVSTIESQDLFHRKILVQ